MTPSTESVKIRRVFARNPVDAGVVAIAGRFGSRAREAERFITFAMVGALGAVIDAGTLFLLQATVLAPVDPNRGLKVALASSIAFFVAVCSNFYWNRVWTYPDSRSRSMRPVADKSFGRSMSGGTGRPVLAMKSSPFASLKRSAPRRVVSSTPARKAMSKRVRGWVFARLARARS